MGTLRGHEYELKGLSFSPINVAGKDYEVWQVATCSADRNIRINDMSSEQTFMWRSIHTFTGHNGPVIAIAYSRDGTKLVSASHDTTGKIWDLSEDDHVDWSEIAHLKGHTEIVKACDFHPNLKWVGTASLDKKAIIWDIDGIQVMTLKGHRDGVEGISFSPDGLKVVTCSWDNTIKVWDAKGNWPELTTMKGHSAAILSVHFWPNSTMDTYHQKPGTCCDACSSGMSKMKISAPAADIPDLAALPAPPTQSIATPAITMLIGLFAGSGLTFGVLQFCHAGAPAPAPEMREVPLLTA
jgi:WD40 repeat protein